MAKQKTITVQVVINAVGLEDQISSATLTYEAEELDTTAFNDLARRREGGLKNGSLSLNWKPNDDLSTTVKAIFDLLGTVVTGTMKLEDAAIADANPEMQFSVLVSQALPFGGTVGDLYEPSTTWPIDGVVTMDVTP